MQWLDIQFWCGHFFPLEEGEPCIQVDLKGKNKDDTSKAIILVASAVSLSLFVQFLLLTPFFTILSLPISMVPTRRRRRSEGGRRGRTSWARREVEETSHKRSVQQAIFNEWILLQLKICPLTKAQLHPSEGWGKRFT